MNYVKEQVLQALGREKLAELTNAGYDRVYQKSILRQFKSVSENDKTILAATIKERAAVEANQALSGLEDKIIAETAKRYDIKF